MPVSTVTRPRGQPSRITDPRPGHHLHTGEQEAEEVSDDPPLFTALAAMHGLTPRHQLREDRMTYDYDPDPRGHAYGADDDPRGPQAPPLDPSGGYDDDTGESARHTWPFGWTDIAQQADPAITALSGRDDPGTSVGTGLVACPTCGTGVTVDRIQG